MGFVIKGSPVPIGCPCWRCNRYPEGAVSSLPSDIKVPDKCQRWMDCEINSKSNSPVFDTLTAKCV